MTRVSRLTPSLLLLAALVVSGCGAYPGSTDGARGERGERAGMMGLMGGMFGGHGKGGPGMGGPGMGGPGMSGHHRGGQGGHGKGGFGLPGLPLHGIELTADQQAALKAIATKYQPTAPDQATRDARQAAGKARQEALKAALTAEPFDAAALRTALTPPADAQKPQRDPQALVEARAVLTDAQRATLIAKLKETPADLPARAASERPDFGAKLAETLTLTDAQKAKLEAVKAARPAPDHAAHRAAMLAFLETGDAASLPADRARPTPPIDAIVDFVGSLDAAQRAKLDGGFLFGGRGGRGFGGKGGHGFGGRGGHRGGHH